MSIFGDVANWFGGSGSNPANAAMPYLNQIPGMLQGYYNPYIQAGMGALPNLQQQFSAMMNPNFINNFGKSFQQSPGYQFNLNQQLDAANRAAAAGGYTGTPMAQQNSQQVASGLANQDYYNWLNHGLGAMQTGLAGEQGLYNTGFNASNQLANSLGANLMSQANLAYAGQQNQNQMGAGILGAGLGLLGGGLFGHGFGSQGEGDGSSYGMPSSWWMSALGSL